MTNALLRWIVLTIAIVVAEHLSFLGISYDHISDAVVAALILGIINLFVRPVLLLISLPLIIFTLGLFMLFINAFLLLLVSHLVTGFHVSGFWSAFGGSIVISVVSFFLGGGMRVRRREIPPRSRDGGQVIDI